VIGCLDVKLGGCNVSMTFPLSNRSRLHLRTSVLGGCNVKLDIPTRYLVPHFQCNTIVISVFQHNHQLGWMQESTPTGVSRRDNQPDPCTPPAYLSRPTTFPLPHLDIQSLLVKDKSSVLTLLIKSILTQISLICPKSLPRAFSYLNPGLMFPSACV
jgi:hypothetical protein